SRNYDALGRYGGEEFLLLLPGCGCEAAERQAERMRQEIERLPFHVEDKKLRVAASFGVTALPQGQDATSEELLRTADVALYRAKEEGRNRVVCLRFAVA
ncbi:MAG: GGDEF domain-containing protein, partial [bacterium]|nr:GGDEF domain-containing protein [bacterium]